jgi:hypothetical protein
VTDLRKSRRFMGDAPTPEGKRLWNGNRKVCANP